MGLDQAPVQLHGNVSRAKSLGVIGITVSFGGKGIVNVHPNTPAEKAGLKKGDKILKVEDAEGRHDIDGKPYTEVSLTIKRGDLAPFIVIVQRLPHQKVENKDVQKYFKGREDFIIGDDD